MQNVFTDYQLLKQTMLKLYRSCTFTSEIEKLNIIHVLHDSAGLI